MRTTRKRLFILLALGSSFAFACGIAEVGLRIAGYDRTYVNPLHSFHERDPRVGYCGKPDFVGRFYSTQFDVVVAHDSDGFRRQEVRNKASDPANRIFVLGDSYVWGWGVGQGQGLHRRNEPFAAGI